MSKRADGKPIGSPRYFQCEGCRRRFKAKQTGRLPLRCDECVPRKVATHRSRAARLAREVGRLAALAEKRREHVESLRESMRWLRAERDAALAEAKQAKAELSRRRGGEPSERAVFDEVETHARKLGPPGADTVKVALVRLRHAEGASGTAAAAEDLAAALICWARALRSPGDQIEAQRARHAA